MGGGGVGDPPGRAKAAERPTVGRCTAIVRAGSDIVAIGFRGGALTSTISLTGKPRG